MRRRLGAAALALLLAAALVVVHDLGVPTSRQYTTRAALAAIGGYRAHVSHWMGYVTKCRFRPTCSAYALGAVKKYGAFRGVPMALWRVARCNPLTPLGTIDLP